MRIQYRIANSLIANVVRHLKLMMQYMEFIRKSDIAPGLRQSCKAYSQWLNYTLSQFGQRKGMRWTRVYCQTRPTAFLRIPCGSNVLLHAILESVGDGLFLKVRLSRGSTYIETEHSVSLDMLNTENVGLVAFFDTVLISKGSLSKPHSTETVIYLIDVLKTALVRKQMMYLEPSIRYHRPIPDALQAIFRGL